MHPLKHLLRAYAVFCNIVGMKVDTQIFKIQSPTSRSSWLCKGYDLFTGNYAECVKHQKVGIQRKK